MFTIREARQADLPALLQLYTHLHNTPPPAQSAQLSQLWRQILDDPNHHVLLGLEGDEPISSCVLLVVPNLTHGQRPYAIVENVVTHSAHRGKGHATSLLHHARSIAIGQSCYKIMLMTGSKQVATLRFYERAGYNRQDKTAFIQWLD